MICEAALCDDFDLVEAAVLRELERICKGAGDGIRRMAVTVDHDLTAAGAALLPLCEDLIERAADCCPISWVCPVKPWLFFVEFRD